MTYEEASRKASRDEDFMATVYAMNTLLIHKGVYTKAEFRQLFVEWMEKEERKKAKEAAVTTTNSPDGKVSQLKRASEEPEKAVAARAQAQAYRTMARALCVAEMSRYKNETKRSSMERRRVWRERFINLRPPPYATNSP